MARIIATPEIYGALTGNLETSVMEEFVAQPTAFLKDQLGVESDIDLKAIKNTIDSINVALPYYSTLEKSAGVMLSDDDLEIASGGAGVGANHQAVENMASMGGPFAVVANAINAVGSVVAPKPSGQTEAEMIAEHREITGK